MSKSGDSFGSRLQRLRVQSGKSQRDVASELTQLFADFKISQANVSHLERRRDAPRQEILNILGKYFGVPVEYFVRHADDSYEARKPHIESYFGSLRGRKHSEGEIILHTDGNKSRDKDVLDTTDNLPKFYRNTDILED